MQTGLEDLFYCKMFLQLLINSFFFKSDLFASMRLKAESS
jgi:hypothetical protein